ncbi:hypothetical protein TNIN_427741 [Trichonephila inaurata madagascariensis]|uniref:Endonuclease/exonuclease/phosphatase domain-containing protein n=1 Tax=Trichonephila inaurata madagascariensis TaxID=2747483 RepID=A0A8X6MII1_9ARAC|nr:hypothetical protein TNIN_427741 [Trichonephila inaurata madagascariensis]
MIKRSIPHHQIIINNNSFENTAIKLNRQNDPPVTIVSAYHPPRKPIVVEDLHQIFRNQGHVLVAGDLNAKQASWSPLTQQNTPGNIIRRFCDSTGYYLNAPSEPTCFRRSYRSTTIDIAICKGMTVTDCSSISELSSDHNLVLLREAPFQENPEPCDDDAFDHVKEESTTPQPQFQTPHRTLTSPQKLWKSCSSSQTKKHLERWH